ncbi:hypothetical protein [Bythopirellula goksoeyrii]|uniref:Uncharacterized protein n=1 Tax=Bythopirellula goksoeyrii TaxID=1400387 RepID=A0A5B9Q3H5_9BACT|nr:hypothetical protein [Bythopirellula goksoeyrii]QEG33578.1 hypothetical protein Pr1d_08420 [Bythopirellula goksoeyrii]
MKFSICPISASRAPSGGTVLFSCFCSLILVSICSADLVIESDQRLSHIPERIERIVNHGTFVGSASNVFQLGPTTRVSGSGRFENTLMYGVFAPGNSPGVTTGLNQAFGGTLEIELGGTTPGFGSGRHYQINDDGTITLVDDLPVLSILSFESYVPNPGDEFEVLTWQNGLVGNFSNTLIDSTFTTSNITFEQIITNPTGVGNLTLRAVAVPEARVIYLWLALSAVVLLRHKLASQHQHPTSLNLRS